MVEQLLIVFVLILANGFFSGAEMAIVASRKGRLRRLAEHGDQAARKALDLASSPDKFLPTVQIGITLVGTLAAAYGGSQVVSNIANWLAANGPPAIQPVAESVAHPDLYHENNVMGSQNLIHCIKEQGIKKIIFSSSATVYGDPQYLPIDEDHPVQPFNPYGETKAQVEQLFLQDDYFKTASVKLLRYFNPVGSYKGIIGEKPNGIPNNLMPYILGVAQGKYQHLNIYGDDYETEDGTGGA